MQMALYAESLMEEINYGNDEESACFGTICG